jgi:aspartate-semialdehyde dehydrogenase
MDKIRQSKMTLGKRASPQNSYNIVVVGATGNVGSNILKILDERNFPVDEIYALASRQSIGKQVSFGERKNLTVDAIENFDFSQADIAIFAAGGEVAKKYAPIAAKNKCIVIDNSSYFRMHSDVPLIVPEVNADAIKDISAPCIISNPNCVAVPLVMALKPLHDLSLITRVVVSTYQSVSGAGKKAMDELYEQTKGVFIYKKTSPKQFSRQIAFNVIPQIDSFDENGFTKEENKIREEVKKILGSNKIEVVPTSVRVPVFIGHSISVNIEFEKNITLEKTLNALKKAPGIILSDYQDSFKYTTPIECAGKDSVYVSRVRRDPSVKNGICMWLASDNMRKGAALNAIQIAEILKNKYL